MNINGNISLNLNYHVTAGQRAAANELSKIFENNGGKIPESMKVQPADRDTVEISGEGAAFASDKAVIIGDVPFVPASFGHEAKESTVFTHENVSETAKALSSLMDENNENMKVQIDFGMSEKQLAEHFGKIGKQLDEAFSAGKITQQEYDDLNKGLETYTEAMSSKAERRAAAWEIAKQSAKAVRSMIERDASKEEMAEYAEDFKNTFQSRIDKFVEEYCSIDRFLLASMIQQVRNGASLFPEGTVHTFSRENARGYFKNGYEPFVPIEY